MKFPALTRLAGDAWTETGQYQYYIGRLQRIYAGFNTNTSWLSLDHFFYFSATTDFPQAFFFLQQKSCYSNTWDALLRIICYMAFWHLTFWAVTCDL